MPKSREGDNGGSGERHGERQPRKQGAPVLPLPSVPSFMVGPFSPDEPPQMRLPSFVHHQSREATQQKLERPSGAHPTYWDLTRPRWSYVSCLAVELLTGEGGPSPERRLGCPRPRECQGPPSTPRSQPPGAPPSPHKTWPWSHTAASACPDRP